MSAMESKSIFVSVIVPVYNVENYLERCVVSILQQSYTNYELLLIDDGSTDSSGSFCDELAKRDERIRVFHKTNGGLSDARNYGMAQAKGECYTFIDSDDYIAAGYLETLVALMIKYDADVSAVGAQVLENGVPRKVSKKLKIGNAVRDPVDVERAVDSEEALLLLLLQQGGGMTACAKLYRKELFDEVQYPIGMLYEDLMTTPVIISRCKRLAYTGQKYYYYVQNEGSITHSSFDEKQWNSWLSAIENTEKIVKEKYPQNLEAFTARYVRDLFVLVLQRVIYSDDHKKQLKSIREISKPRLKLFWKNQYLPLLYKAAVGLFLLSPGLCRIALLLLLKMMRV